MATPKMTRAQAKPTAPLERALDTRGGQPLDVNLGDLSKMHAPPRVAAGSLIRVGITIKDWSAEALARHPDPECWTHVNVDLFCERATPSWLNQSPWRSPHLPQKVTHDGQRFEWTFDLPDGWGVEKDVHFVFYYTDPHGLPPKYVERTTLKLVILPAA